MKPDKGNGAVVMDKKINLEKMYQILAGESKFKKRSNDPTILREGKLQRFLRKLNKKGFFSSKQLYESIYPSVQPSRLYGLPKLHKVKRKSEMPPFRHIISSVGSYNYNLAKFLCDLITPYISSEHCTEDSFTFVKEVLKIFLWFHMMFVVCLQT